MKRILAAMLAALMLFSFAAAEAPEVTGEWYSSLFGVTMILTLNPDGTYLMAAEMDDLDPEPGAWELRGADLLLDKGTEAEVLLTYDAQENTYFAHLEEADLVFSRERAAAFALAPARTDAAAADYAGSWRTALVSMVGMQIPPEVAHLWMAMTASESLAEVTFHMDGEEIAVQLAPEYTDGAMRMTVYAGEEPYAIVAQLLEDGRMSAQSELFGEEITFVMEKE